MSHPHDAHPPYHDPDADAHDPHDADADAANDDDDAFSTATSSSGGAAGLLPGDEEEEEEDESCPLCMEPFDATDKEFTPCKCGYKICLWCLTGDHQVLTRSGWQSIRLVAVGEVVASYNVGSRAMEWKKVEEKQCYATSASEQHQLFRMEGAGMDVVATRNHRMLVAQLCNGHLQKRLPFSYPTVEKLLELTYSKGTEPAEGERNTTTQFDRTMARAVLRSGVNNEKGYQFSIPGLKAVCAWWWQKDGQMGFLRFLGLWLGDGHLVFGRSTSYVCITQRKPEPTEWLTELLDEVFPRWWFRVQGREDANGTTWTYYIRCPPLVDWLAVMAAGPQGYSPVDPVAVRSYPHFTYDGGLAAVESQSLYRQPCSVGRWTEPVMLAAMATVGCCWWCGKSECAEGEQWLLCNRLDRTRCNRGGHLSCAGLTETPEGEWMCPDCDGTSQEYMRETDSQPAEEEGMEVEEEAWEAENEEKVEAADGEVEVSGLLDDAAAKAARVAGKLLWWNNTAPVAPIVVAPALLPPPLPAVQPPPLPPPVPNPGNVTIPPGAAIVPWNNGWWIIINGHWFYLKRWMGANVASTFSHMSQKQAVALLEGFHRADGSYASIQFDERGEPTGCWFCSNSSFPLISHLMLIGQLAGASVDLTLRVKAGMKSFVEGRQVRCTVDHWMLSMHFSPPARTAPVHSVYLAKPEPADDIAKRGYYGYEDDGNVYCITVKDNHNFLTQRLSMKRLQSEKGELGVRAQPVFVGNCWHNLNNIYTNTTNASSTASASSSSTSSASASSSTSPPSSLSSSLSSTTADRPPLAGRCPACRQPYVYPDRLFNADTLQSSLSNKQKKKSDRSAPSASSSSTSTAQRKAIKELDHRTLQQQQMRVLQRNLMYVLNLPPSVAKEEVLVERRYFGKFGKILNCKVASTRKTASTSSSASSAAKASSSSSSSSSSPSTASYSAYVTFKRPSDCAMAISLSHHTSLSGHTIKAMYGTTKYCAYYARGVPCTMVKCSYLHEPAKAEDVVGKEELAAMERYREHEKPTPFPLQLTVAEAVSAAKASRAVQPAEEGELHEGSSKASTAAATPAAATVAPVASVWGSRAAQPVSSLFPSASSSSTTSSSPPPASASASSSTSAPSSSPSTSSASASSTASSPPSSLRPYVSILAQSQSVTHPSSTAQPASPAPVPASNEIIRIVPAFLKDKFSASSPPASPSAASASAAGKKKGTAASNGVGLTLSPVSTASSISATPSIITASPSMSRSTSKASSSSSSRPGSPHHSPLMQLVDHSPSCLSPATASQSQSPHPPALEPPPRPPSLPSSPTASFIRTDLPPPPTPSAPLPQLPTAALPDAPRPPPSEDFDFLLYSLSDFTPFFHSHAAHDPNFSWLLTPSHARSYPLRPLARSQAGAESVAPELVKGGVRKGREGEEGSKGGGLGGLMLQEVDRRVRLEKEREMGWDEQKGAEEPMTSPRSSAPAIAVRGGHRTR